MKFLPQDKAGPLIVRTLDEHGRMTIRELSVATAMSADGVRKAMHRLLIMGLAVKVSKRYGKDGYGSGVYELAGGVESEEPLSPSDMEVRAESRAKSDETVARLRGGYRPSRYEPFRVIAAQVSA